jgi:UDP-N-acetylglucosamine transferase subunit ALG13
MIFVAVGTHHAPFDRLLRVVDALAATTGEPFVVQRGASRLVLSRCQVVDTLPPAALTEHLSTARRIVLHGGSSLFLEARSLGRVPVIVPRRARFGEHVDDHQVEFARSLAPTEARVCAPEDLGALLTSWEEPRGVVGDRGAAFARRLTAAVDALVAARRGPGGA